MAALDEFFVIIPPICPQNVVYFYRRCGGGKASCGKFMDGKKGREWFCTCDVEILKLWAMT
jgi:hypothetical protein